MVKVNYLISINQSTKATLRIIRCMDKEPWRIHTSYANTLGHSSKIIYMVEQPLNVKTVFKQMGTFRNENYMGKVR